MAKILSKSGDSLADVYDVAGSIAGIDDLQSKDVNLVHEMGATIFSERLVTRIVVLESGAINQNTDSDISLDFDQPARLLAASIISDPAARVLRGLLTLSTGSSGNNTDFPIFAWGAGDPERTLKVRVLGTSGLVGILLPVTPPMTPNMIAGKSDVDSAFSLAMHVRSTSFGAGTIKIFGLFHVAFAESGGLSSRGLPIPSW